MNFYHIDLLLTYEERSTLLTCSQCPVHYVSYVPPPAGSAVQRSSPSHTPPAALSASCSHAAAWWTFLWTTSHTRSVFPRYTQAGSKQALYCQKHYLYSMGINSAARLSWLGLPEGIIPTWNKHVRVNVRVAKQRFHCQTWLSSHTPAWESWCCWAWVHRSSSLISFRESLSMMIL